MIIGVPREMKEEENRVAITPGGVAAFKAHGHMVLVEKGAGKGSGISDREYQTAGAEIVEDRREVWNGAELVLKVKEPIEEEYEFLREGQILFTYLHLAANRDLALKLLEKRVTAVAYETVELEDGSLPLLAPMSEVAGRLSIQKGAYCLEAKNGGSGILLSGVSGVPPAKVVILGAGIVGSNACHVAVGVGAKVSILDVNPSRLRYISDIMHGQVTTVMSNRSNIEEEVLSADLVIGAVLIPGARAPKLVTEDMVRRMKPGSAILDVAVDQGGCCETIRPTTHANPIYIVHDVVHYGVTNMPGAVPRTSTFALTNSTLGYAMEIADRGFENAMKQDAALRRGLNAYQGRITCKAVAEALELQYSEPDF